MDSPLRVVIIDDEPLARSAIRSLVEERCHAIVAGEGSGVDARDVILRTRPDIIFLDIQMPEVDGFGVLEQIGADAAPAIVFVTAYDKYALKAFEVHAIDYLLKPFDDGRFLQAFEHATSRVLGRRRGELDARVADLLRERATFQARFLVPVRDKTIVVEVEQIDWIEAADYYVSLHVGAASHLLRETMDEIEAKLDPRQFFRIHRSTIVNIDRVRELHPLFRGDCELLLSTGARVRLSRSRRKEFEALFAQPRPRKS